MLKRILVLLLMLGLLGWAVMVGAQDQVEVTFWHAMSKAHQATLQSLADQFMEQHPDIKITLVYQGHYGDLSQKLLAAVAAGNPPVMAQMYEDWTMKFLEAEALMPLEPYIPEEVVNDLPEALITTNTFIVDGQPVLLTVPFNKSAMVLFYNTDLIDKPPATWWELLQMSKELTVDKDGDGTIDQYGFGIRPYPEFFIEFFHQAGGRLFNEDKTKCLINELPGVLAMYYLAYIRDYSLYQTAYLSGPFGDGRVAMYIGSSAGIPFVASASEGKHGWMTADLPVGPVNGESMIQGTNLGVFTIGTTEEQRQAAVEFIKFLLTPEAQLEWAKGTGYLPVLKSLIESDEWKSYIEENPERKAPTDMLLKGFVYPHHPNMYNIRQVIGTAFEKVMLGQASPEEALNEAAAEIESEYLVSE